MDFLLSDSLLKWELLFLGLNLAYILIHLMYEIFSLFVRIKNIVKPKRLMQTQETQTEENGVDAIESEDVSNTVAEDVSEDKDSDKKENAGILKEKEKKSTLSQDEKEEISEIIRVATTKINRGEYNDAKAKIIEGLSMDKFNKQLNILLASLYEKDKDYKKAELIYKDLIVMNDHDTELYLKLGFILSIQSKYEVAYEIYKKLFSIDKSNIEAIEMISNIGHHLGNFAESAIYAKLFLKKNPRNVDMLYLQALNHINIEDRKEALDILKKVRQLEPYNTKVNELMQKLELEIELDNNFNRTSIEG